MIGRRRAILGLITLPTLMASRQVHAQTVPMPSIDALAKLLELPALAEKAALGTSALRTLIWFEASRSDSSDTFAALTKDSKLFFDTINQLRDAGIRQSVRASLASEEVKKRVEDTTNKAMPTVKRIEETLSKGGLPPAAPLSKDLLTSFLQVNQFVVALSPNNDGWYCKVYPFRIVCG